jgi:phosphopantothenoylcysteine decarboxylase/phosphopantothenate--cysteine ligase
VKDQKINKKESTLDLRLEKTADILKTLGLRKRDNQVLVGFALETTGGEQYAKEKLKSKNADLIVLNTLEDEGAGFGHDTNKITIYEKGGKVFPFNKKSKSEVASDIVATIIDQYYA